MKGVPSCIRPQVAFRAIQAYAAHSYLYYELDTSIISDHEFDELCVWLKANYSWVKPHDINNYLQMDQLECGSGNHLVSKICGQTLEYALSLRDSDPLKL